MSELNIKQKLCAIQTEIKAKKNKYNAFGKYHYRNLEGIYEALKPLLKEHGCYLVIDNEIEVIGDRLFRKSIATLGCIETDSEISAKMYTQEATDKKGMSPEQCSGSSASYGDKYVLNKLFCLDDSEDVDPDSKNPDSFMPDSDAPADYKPKFGKFAGKPLKSIDPNELNEYCIYVKGLKDQSDMTRALLDNARKYLASVKR